MKKCICCSVIIGMIIFLGVFTTGCPKKPPTPLPVTEPEKKAVEPLPSPPAPEIGEVKELPVDAAARGLAFEFNENVKDIFFEFDKSRLTDESKETLKRNAGWLKGNPDLKIMIEGHCDERGMDAYNLALGDQRANRVKEYLETIKLR